MRFWLNRNIPRLKRGRFSSADIIYLYILFIYLYIFVHTHIDIYIYIYIYPCTYRYLCSSVYINIFICICVCKYIWYINKIIYIYIDIYIYMNLYTYHCDPREGRGNFYHRGWSLIVWSYTIFWIFPLIFYVKRTKTTCPFCIFVFLWLLPNPLNLFFSTSERNKAETGRIWWTGENL